MLFSYHSNTSLLAGESSGQETMGREEDVLGNASAVAYTLNIGENKSIIRLSWCRKYLLLNDSMIRKSLMKIKLRTRVGVVK